MTGSSGNPYRYYTKEEIEAAKDTDLPDLLVSLGYHIKPVGRFHTALEMDSLRIFDRRTWFRYSESIGGDAIEFLRHFHGMSFSETLKFLLEYSGRDPTAPRPCQRPRPLPRPPFVLPPPNGDNQRVYAYLRRRGIAPGVIGSFIKAGLLYEDNYHNCLFIGRDGACNPVFATKRGTGTIPFKCDVAGSDKRIAFRLPCLAAQDSVYVFEAPIDMMSWFTLYGWSNAVALCGLHDAPLEAYLADYPHIIGRIVLGLDADDPGRGAAGRLAAKYGGRGFKVEDRVPPSGKDWNEYLQSRPP